VAIARAVVGEPAIILADEPTGNLDTTTGREVIDVFRALHIAGHTILLITHDAQVAAAAPRTLSLRDGRIESDEVTS
jgi:putative ABC transport system ATP-binding protein